MNATNAHTRSTNLAYQLERHRKYGRHENTMKHTNHTTNNYKNNVTITKKSKFLSYSFYSTCLKKRRIIFNFELPKSIVRL